MSLPALIPPQNTFFGKADSDGNVTVEINWYMFLYNIALQVLSSTSGSIAVSPIDLALIGDQDIQDIPSAQSLAVTDSTDPEVLDADVAQLRVTMQALQALVADATDSAVSTNSGNVAGPTSSVSGDVVLFDGTSGKLIKDGGALGTAAFTASTAYLAAGGTAADSSKLQSATWAQPGAIGATTTSSGKFTTCQATTPVDSLNSGIAQFKSGTLNVAAHSFTVIGTPTYSGTYTRVGNRVFCTISASSTTSIACIGNTSNFTGLPYTSSGWGCGVFQDLDTISKSGGVGVLSNTVYPETWAATANVVLRFDYVTTDAF